MKNKASAKIIYHAEGVGPPDVELVRQRALEIARIDGRKEHNEGDWDQAWSELHGHQHTSAGEQETETIFSGHDMVAYDAGHRAENVGSETSDNIAEELIAEGMEEAVHDQMLEAAVPEEEEEGGQPS